MSGESGNQEQQIEKTIIEKIQEHFRQYRARYYFRVFYLVKDPEHTDSYTREAILRLVPLETLGFRDNNNYYLLLTFSENLESRKFAEARLLYAEKLSKVYLDLLNHYLGTQVSETLNFRVMIPIRPFYRGKFVRMLYPSVLTALVLNYYSSRVDSKIFSKNIIKEFISQVPGKLKPIYYEGKVIRIFNKKYVIGNFSYLVDTSWKYYYLMKFVEFLSKHLLEIPKIVVSRIEEILKFER
jgi:uncharacterized ubiquitin-like protein YukD